MFREGAADICRNALAACLVTLATTASADDDSLFVGPIVTHALPQHGSATLPLGVEATFLPSFPILAFVGKAQAGLHRYRTTWAVESGLPMLGCEFGLVSDSLNGLGRHVAPYLLAPLPRDLGLLYLEYGIEQWQDGTDERAITMGYKIRLFGNPTIPFPTHG